MNFNIGDLVTYDMDKLGISPEVWAHCNLEREREEGIPKLLEPRSYAIVTKVGYLRVGIRQDIKKEACNLEWNNGKHEKICDKVGVLNTCLKYVPGYNGAPKDKDGKEHHAIGATEYKRYELKQAGAGAQRKTKRRKSRRKSKKRKSKRRKSKTRRRSR
jgi:hypothetical protein